MAQVEWQANTRVVTKNALSISLIGANLKHNRYFKYIVMLVPGTISAEHEKPGARAAIRLFLIGPDPDYALKDP